ncbi:hypothetical protein F511_44159 [Dorcoceras hygrometricum]|uniref:Uncharacterized protein n=1 Tax=Dorcoceras hygrometricum TaxID=472368 RepID=A0A2Z7A5X3_9LAMI|nr:hypothetical protein F511_44159 [Dorcoceras hygrometricum]
MFRFQEQKQGFKPATNWSHPKVNLPFWQVRGHSHHIISWGYGFPGRLNRNTL